MSRGCNLAPPAIACFRPATQSGMVKSQERHFSRLNKDVLSEDFLQDFPYKFGNGVGEDQVIPKIIKQYEND